jgi:hypothetical protein
VRSHDIRHNCISCVIFWLLFAAGIGFFWFAMLMSQAPGQRSFNLFVLAAASVMFVGSLLVGRFWRSPYVAELAMESDIKWRPEIVPVLIALLCLAICAWEIRDILSRR